jgi:glycosidase
MGVDIIWLMPVHPIGEKNRKGALGNPYAVKDYYGINPELGTMADFKALVTKIHSMGMHVVLDWVGSQSALDNALVAEHPDWYTKTPRGNSPATPGYDRGDVTYLDYNKPGVREYMTKALTHWVRETGIDGYHCDMAEAVPVDFWENARQELAAIKSVFMLAEWESSDLPKGAFDMTYSSNLYDRMHSITMDKKSAAGLAEYIAQDSSALPRDTYRMLFTENHNKNAWTGAPYTQFGKGLEACLILTGTMNGMPMVYSGQ